MKRKIEKAIEEIQRKCEELARAINSEKETGRIIQLPKKPIEKEKRIHASQ